MITITLEQGNELGKTHFKDIDELITYLTGRSVRYPHDDPEFMAELLNRSAEIDRDPSTAISWEEMLQNLKRK